MDAAAFRHPNDIFDIDVDFFDVEMDRESARREPAKSSILESGPQFANDLAQRGAGFFLVRATPQQADHPLAAFLFGLGQGQIAENSPSLLGSELDQSVIESYREAPHQRYGKARGASGRRCGLGCSQPSNPD